MVIDGEGMPLLKAYLFTKTQARKSTVKKKSKIKTTKLTEHHKTDDGLHS